MNKVKPYSTIEIWFTTLDDYREPAEPSSALTVSDFAIHKNRADVRGSTSGMTLSGTVNGQTGLHHLEIDLGDNTDVGFYENEDRYAVIFNTTKTVGGKPLDGRVLREFVITTDGDPILLSTEISSVSSQTSLVLKDTAPNNDAYNNAYAIITDASTNLQKSVVWITDHVAASKTITLQSAAVFTVATGDRVDIYAASPEVQRLAGHTAQTGDNYAVLANDIAGLGNGQTLYEQLKDLRSSIESLRGKDAELEGDVFYVDAINGDTHANGNRGGFNDPYASINDCLTNAVTSGAGDTIYVLPGMAGAASHSEAVSVTKSSVKIRSVGRVTISNPSAGDTVTIAANDVDVSGFGITTAGSGTGHGVSITGDRCKLSGLRIYETRGDGINALRCDDLTIEGCFVRDAGQSGAGHGIYIDATSGASQDVHLFENIVQECASSGITAENGTITGLILRTNISTDNATYGIDISSASTGAVIVDNRYGGNTTADIRDNGTNSIVEWNEEAAGGGATAADIADAVWDEQTSTHVVSGSFGEALGAGGDGPSPAQIADAVWDELNSQHTTAGTYGRIFNGISSLADWLGAIAGKSADATTLAEIQNTSAGLTFDNTTDSLEALQSVGVTVDEAGIADAVWDELTAGHAISGSFGNTVATGTSPAAIADAVWDEATASHTTTGTYGAYVTAMKTAFSGITSLGNWLGAIVGKAPDPTTLAEINSTTAGVNYDNTQESLEARFDSAGADLTAVAWNSAWDAEVQSEVADALAAFTGTSFTAIPWNAAWDAQVQSEVADALAAYNAVATTDLPTNFGDLAITATTGRVTVGTNADKTGYSISGTLTTLDALDTAQDTQHGLTRTDIAAQNDLSAAEVRTAVGLASANLDTQLSGIASQITTVDGVVDSILVDTGTTIPAQITALNNLSSTDVADELAAIGLDHLVSAAVTAPDITDNSIIARMVSKSATAQWSTFDQTTDSLEALADQADGGDGSGFTAIPWNAAWDAQVQSEVADALTAYNVVATTDLPTNFGDLAITATTGRVTVGTNADKTGYSISGTLTTLDALDTAQDVQHAATQADIAAQNDLNAAEVRAAVGLAAANLDTQLTAIDDAATAILLDTGTTLDGKLDAMDLKLDTIDGIVDSILVDTGATIPTQISGLNNPTAAAIADAVWDEPNAAHSVGGSTGANLAVINSVFTDTDSTIPGLITALNDPTAAEIADAVWDEAASGHATAGTFGAYVGTINTNVATLISRITSTLFSGITSFASWMGALAGKTVDNTTLTEIQATTAGAGYDNTTDSQEALRDRGDADWSVTGTATIAPLSAHDVQRVKGTTYTFFTSEIMARDITIYGSGETPRDLSGKTLRLTIELDDSPHTDVQVVENEDLTISGASNNVVTFTNSAAVTSKARTLRWSLRDVSTGEVLGRGKVNILEAALKDA